jgi:hypothetical protein
MVLMKTHGADIAQNKYSFECKSTISATSCHLYCVLTFVLRTPSLSLFRFLLLTLLNCSRSGKFDNVPSTSSQSSSLPPSSQQQQQQQSQPQQPARPTLQLSNPLQPPTKIRVTHTRQNKFRIFLFLTLSCASM